MKHQSISTAQPELGVAAQSMMSGNIGEAFYRNSQGDDWLLEYGPLGTTRLAIGVASNHSAALGSVKRIGWLSVGGALFLGVGLAAVLVNLARRSTKSLSHVAAGAAAIAKGELDMPIELRSRDYIRPLADSVNALREQLREQMRRENETRQIDAFVRLSAMLTHDLKNAINGVSLIVSNMDKHFDEASFRSDAVQSLTEATEQLQSLVDRLSNPATSLSGEFKRPERSDLVPIIWRALRVVGLKDTDVETDLPQSLYASVNPERIQKVVENLLVNAIEAMSEKDGKLKIAAGQLGSRKVWISVSDDGDGMSNKFIEERLFRPFSTTKKKGLGLGLYTCREIVNAHGGSIEVTSSKGVGTTFRVVLPSDISAEIVKT
jgi:signal transduction histidine kinase